MTSRRTVLLVLFLALAIPALLSFQGGGGAKATKERTLNVCEEVDIAGLDGTACYQGFTVTNSAQSPASSVIHVRAVFANGQDVEDDLEPGESRAFSCNIVSVYVHETQATGSRVIWSY